MSRRPIKIDPAILRALGSIPYEVEIGSKHAKLRIGGRLVVVLPNDYNCGGGSQGKNAVAAVRRFLRTMEITK